MATEVAVGNRSLLDDLKLDAGELARRAETLRANGQTIMFVVVDEKPAGLIGVADPIKDDNARCRQTTTRRRHSHRDAHRRQPHDCRSCSTQAGDR